MRSHLQKVTALTTLVFSLSILLSPIHTYAQNPSSRPEEIEWTWEVRPSHVDTKLPNVLLVGDSISRNYYPEVQRQLDKVANVYLMATSTSIGDPRLPLQIAEFARMESVPFKVVHFNNGMHGWTYSEPEYRAAFPSLLAALHSIASAASFVWATTTPVKEDATPGPTNLRIEARNSIALSFIKSANIPIDDQHELMSHHADQYEDKVHFNIAGAAIQGQQAAQSIRLLLTKP
ncbi:SGNH/GDSL hydrolase family protein [Granulicella sp. dw_53]|uniref:SGNH/GDSL hydrolase family protein n=1 Tax=Granulicella sp. dw_53 TaxID=2719792 RepID=UPI001BD36F16|nr:SGNH/GDSL hydrolase family protein [Granulicella sp. dw_53]